MSYVDSASHDHHDHKPGFIKRWFFSTNHKDIGTLYIIFAILAGLVGGFFSLLMRAELAAPGLDVVADGQVWNVIITAHGLLMVFFVVMPALIGGYLLLIILCHLVLILHQVSSNSQKKCHHVLGIDTPSTTDGL